MPNTTIDTLEVKIKSSAEDATKALDRLATALKNVRSALSGTKNDGTTVSQKLSRSIGDLNTAINKIDSTSVKKLDDLSAAIDRYGNAVNGFKGSVTSSSASQISEIQQAINAIHDDERISEERTVDAEFERLNAVLPDTVNKLKQTNAELVDSDKHVKKVNKNLDKSTSIFDKLWGSIKRIAFYRAIRTALKEISEAFSEGLTNAYMFSKQDVSFKRLAETLDRIKSTTSQMKNQLGAMFGEFIETIKPALEWLIEKVRWLGERITEFFAALNGKETYLQAQLVAVEWQEATENVKKYKNQLLGLDELNNLSTQTTSGKADETDYSNLYKEVPVNEKLLETVGKIKELVLHVADISFDFSDFSGLDLIDKVIIALDAIAGAYIGFKLGGLGGAAIGAVIGAAIGFTITKLDFGSDLTYGKKKLRKILYPVLGGITGAFIGYGLSGVSGVLVGATVGATLGLLLAKLNFGNDSDENSDTVGKMITAVLAGITGAAIGWKVGGLEGAFIGATIGFTIGFLLETFSFSNTENTKDRSKTSLANQLIGSVLVGISGAAIGWKVGGVTGALVGASIGFTLSMLLFNFGFKDSTTSTYETILNGIKTVLGAIAGAAVGFALTGNKAGVVIGANIGISLSLLIQNIDWKAANSAVVGKAQEKLQAMYDDLTPENTTVTTPITGADIQLSPGAAIIEGLNNAFNPQKKALGGVVSQGSLFYAGEAGAEFVGNIGTTSAVANTEQMTDAIYKAAYMGMSRALQENGGMSGYEPATTDDLFIAMRKKASAYNRQTGSSAFA